MAAVEPPDWASLPAALLSRIFAALLESGAGSAGLGAVACTCAAWRSAASDARLWSAALAAERPARGGVRAAAHLRAARLADDAEADEPHHRQPDDASAARAAVRAARAARERLARGQPVRTRVLQVQGMLKSLVVHGHTVLAAFNTGEPQCALQLWDARSGERFARLAAAAPGQAAFSMDWRGGETPVLSGGVDGTVLLWDVSAVRRGVTHRPPLALRLGSTAVCAVALDSASCTAAAGDLNGRVAVWRLRDATEDSEDVQQGAARPAHGAELAQELSAGQPFGSRIIGLQLSHSGDVLAFITFSGDAAVSRVMTGEDVERGEAALLDTGELAATTLSFADPAVATGPLADALVVGTNAGLVVLHGALARGSNAQLPDNARTQLSRSAAVTCHQQGVRGSPELVAAGDQNGCVAVYDARAPPAAAEALLLQRSGFPTRCLHACGDVLVTGHSNGDAQRFDLRNTSAALEARHLGVVPGPRHRESIWALHVDEHRLVTVSVGHRDGAVVVCDWAE